MTGVQAGRKEKPCTPGSWKNHTELWYGPDYCGLTSEEMLCNLQPQCNKDQDAREAASALLERGHRLRRVSLVGGTA